MCGSLREEQHALLPATLGSPVQDYAVVLMGLRKLEMTTHLATR